MNKDAIHFYTNRLRGRRNLLVNLYDGLSQIKHDIRARWHTMKEIESNFEEDYRYEIDMLKFLKKSLSMKQRLHELEREQKEDKACLNEAMREYQKFIDNAKS